MINDLGVRSKNLTSNEFVSRYFVGGKKEFEEGNSIGGAEGVENI